MTITKRVWRGDAVAVAQVVTITPGTVTTGDTYSLRINGKDINIVAGDNTAATLADDFVTEIAASRIPEWREVSATAASGVLTLTSRTAGVPFKVSALVGGFEQSGAIVVTVANQPTGGTWNFDAGDYGKDDIAYNASGATVQTSMDSLFGSGNTTVTKYSSGTSVIYQIDFTGTFTGEAVPGVTVSYANLTGGNAEVGISVVQEAVTGTSEVQRINLYGTPSGGTWTASFQGFTTAPLAYNISTASLQSALEALPSIGTGNIAVSGTAGSQYDCTFQGSLAHTAVDLITVDARGLTGGSIYADATVITQGVAATNQIDYIWIEDKAATQCRIQINKTNFSSWSGGAWSFNATGFSTGSIAYNATDAEIAAAFETALGHPGVIVTSTTSQISIEMVGPNYWHSFSSSSVTSAITGGSVSLGYVWNGSGPTYPTPSGGDYKIGLSIGTPITASISRTATDAQIQAALDSAFGAGNSLVTALEYSGYLTTEKTFKIEWKGIYSGLTLVTVITDGGTASDLVRLSWYQKGAATGTNEVVDIATHGSPASGTSFTVQYGDDVSAAIDRVATASSVQTTLRAMPSITSAGVNASNGALGTNPVRLTFVGPLGYTNIDDLVIDDNNLKQKVTRTTAGVTGKNEIVKLSLADQDVWAGTLTLTYNSHTTGSLDWDSTASEVQAAFIALSDFVDGDVVCTGGPWPESDVYAEFEGNFAETDVSAVTSTSSLKNGVVTAVSYDPMIVEKTTEATGPNHFSEPTNWYNPDTPTEYRAPERDNAVYFTDGKIDCLYGLTQQVVFTVDTSTDYLIPSGDHDLKEGQKVGVWTSNTLPSGLAAATAYYVRNLSMVTGKFQLATTPLGDAVNITSSGTGTHTVGMRYSKILDLASYTGKVGMPWMNSGGYKEYRPLDLKCGLTPDAINSECEQLVTIGQGIGNGSNCFNLNLSDHAGTVEILNSGRSSDSKPAVHLLLNNDSTDINVYGGEVGVAMRPGETSTFGDLVIRGGTVSLGEVAFATIDKTGGSFGLVNQATISGVTQIRS